MGILKKWTEYAHAFRRNFRPEVNTTLAILQADGPPKRWLDQENYSAPVSKPLGKPHNY